MSKPIGWILAALIAVGLGLIYYYQFRGLSSSGAPQTAGGQPNLELPVPQPQPAGVPPIRHPLPAEPGAAGQPGLPPLKESDRALQEAFMDLFGPKPVEDFLIPQNLVRRLVVTIDNLPRRKAALELRPVKPAAGAFLADAANDDVNTGSESVSAAADQSPDAGTPFRETATLNPRNYERYQPMVRLLQGADAKKIAALYLRFYPLFQQAYEDLGYPGRYFNDRLVETLDHLLDTPQVEGPIALVRPKVFYEFADPQLEARSAGQKLLIRMGPENSALVKQKLRELRAEVTRK